MPFPIRSVFADEVLDSRGNPTVRATVVLESGHIGTATVPSGASTGTHESTELRDGGKRYRGLGVKKAVKHVNTTIARALVGFDVTNGRGIDALLISLDGTAQKKKLGANAILGVSLAVARAGAAAVGLPLYRYLRTMYGITRSDWPMPYPTMNVINGGRHAAGALQIQECMIVPLQKTVRERVRVGAEVFHALADVLREKGFTTTVGDEGGFAPKIGTPEEAFELLSEAVVSAGYRLGKDVCFALDLAASEFYDDTTEMYKLYAKRRPISAQKMIETIGEWLAAYPIISIEDPLHEDAWVDWQSFTLLYGDRALIVGDDFFVTHSERLEKGISMGAANAILIKPNQVGTLSETIDAILLAQAHNYRVSVSHRSGETADTFIADLAVAVGADCLKAGSLSRSERVEKYNRLMEIEAEIQAKEGEE